MPLATGSFHTITILQTSDVAWLGLATQPALPSTITDYIVNGTSFDVYVIDAPTGNLAFEGGMVFGLVDAVLNTVSAALSSLTFTANDGDVTLFCKNPATSLVSTYSPTLGVMHTYSAVEAAALKAWLP